MAASRGSSGGGGGGGFYLVAAYLLYMAACGDLAALGWRILLCALTFAATYGVMQAFRVLTGQDVAGKHIAAILMAVGMFFAPAITGVVMVILLCGAVVTRLTT